MVSIRFKGMNKDSSQFWKWGKNKLACKLLSHSSAQRCSHVVFRKPNVTTEQSDGNSSIFSLDFIITKYNRVHQTVWELPVRSANYPQLRGRTSAKKTYSKLRGDKYLYLGKIFIIYSFEDSENWTQSNRQLSHLTALPIPEFHHRQS